MLVNVGGLAAAQHYSLINSALGLFVATFSHIISFSWLTFVLTSTENGPAVLPEPTNLSPLYRLAKSLQCRGRSVPESNAENDQCGLELDRVSVCLRLPSNSALSSSLSSRLVSSTLTV